MGFNSVYQALKELFPQVDVRILKAAAIEHSKDPDGAVESILTEVLPFIRDQSQFRTSVAKNNGKAVETSSQSSTLRGSTMRDIATASDPLHVDHNVNRLCLSERLVNSLPLSFNDAKDSNDNHNGETKKEELIVIGSFAQTSAEASRGSSNSFIADSGKDVCNQVFMNHENEGCLPSHQEQDAGVEIHVSKSGLVFSSSANVGEAEADGRLDFDKEQSLLDCNSLEYQDATEHTLVSAKDHLLYALDLNVPNPQSDHDENQETSSYEDAEFILESAIPDAVGAEDETLLSTIVTRSGHVCRITLLEDLIENAKGHKDTLFSAMESVVELVKDVELEEKAAQQAKEDAARGGLIILEKVEEIKKMLKHAKEANDMHAGEVYGEKSILATEVRELQTRLLGLSEEKDKSLSTLGEMRKTLESRLATAEEERRKAEREIFEKEEIARSALAEQELIMEKVVQESKLLQQQAEENAKLRNFLMEKGRVVDILQGEISVICQDVKSLKENFDNGNSLGKSSSLRQTSSFLSSSNSSAKSVGSDLGLFGSPARTSRPPSVGSQTPRSSVGEEKAVKTGASPRKELLDEDWELFDF